MLDRERAELGPDDQDRGALFCLGKRPAARAGQAGEVRRESQCGMTTMSDIQTSGDRGSTVTGTPCRGWWSRR
jgi:hypothetical protein